MTTTTKKLTLSLLIQAMKFLYLEYYDDLAGSGQLRFQQRFHAKALAKLFEDDVALLYKYLEVVNALDSDFQPYYAAIDFLKECIETACSLSEAAGVESGSGTVGIGRLREILKLVREGKWEAVDDQPETVDETEIQSS